MPEIYINPQPSTVAATQPQPPAPDFQGMAIATPSATAQIPNQQNWTALFQSAGQQYGVDPALLEAQAQVESGTNPATPDSDQGAQGMMQIMPATAQALGVDPSNPQQAVYGAAALMRQNLARYGNVDQAVAAYHGGTNPQNWGPKTLNYVNKVAQTFQQIKAQQPSQGPSPTQQPMQNPTPSAASQPAPSPMLQMMQQQVAGASQNAPSAVAPSMLQMMQQVVANPPPAQAAPTPAPVNFAQQVAAGSQAASNRFDRGVQDVKDTGSYLKDSALNAAGALSDQELAANKAQRNATRSAYDQSNPGFSLSRVAGNVVAALPIMAGGEMALVKGAGALLPGVDLSGAGAALMKAPGMVGRAARVGNSAIQAGIGNVLANDDVGQSTPQTFAEGLGPGAVLHVGAAGAKGAGKYIINAGKAIGTQLTEKGTTRLANEIITRAAGNGPLNVDAREIVPEVTPTLSQATGNAGIGALEKNITSNTPLNGGDVNAFTDKAARDAQTRIDAFNKISGDASDLETMKLQRAKDEGAAINHVFKEGQTTNTKPVSDKIKEILDGPGGGRSSVETSLARVQKVLDKSTNGHPERLYRSVRGEINDAMDRTDLSSAAGRQAASELLSVKSALDNVIEDGAPGFQKAMKDFSDSSRPIDAMIWLQGQKITDASGNLTLSKVQNAIANLQKQKAAPGINEAKSVTEDHQAVLEALRDDLLRVQKAASLSKASGSDTYSNFATDKLVNSLLPGVPTTLASKMAPWKMGALIGAGIGHMSGEPMGIEVGAGLGSHFGEKVGKSIDTAMNKKNQAVSEKIAHILLNPEEFSPVRPSGVRSASQLPGQIAPAGAVGYRESQLSEDGR